MKRGFTLVELLAVVLIVAILTGVGVPQYRKAVDKARVTEAEAMLRTLYDASERLAGEFGYRSYVELVNQKGEAGYSVERFDRFDASRLPAGCTLGSGGVSVTGVLNCSRFLYRILVRGSNERSYVAAKLLTGTHKDTYVMLDRDTLELYCQPKTAGDTDFCDVLGLDVVNAGFDF